MIKKIKLIDAPYFDYGDDEVYQDFEFEGEVLTAYLGRDREFDGSVAGRKQACVEEVKMTKEEV